MKIIKRAGRTFGVLEEFGPLRENLNNDMIVIDLESFDTDHNKLLFVRGWGRYPIMSLDNVLSELNHLEDDTIKWRSESLRMSIFNKLNKVKNSLSSYKREEIISILLNDKELCYYKAC